MASLHVESRGTGSPTVLLESGLGHHSAHWGVVPERVAAVTSVTSYDRPGLGYSTSRHTPLTVASYLADLEPVLERCEPGPLVLVGHSFGGLLIRALAVARPERMGARLFVDSAAENEMGGLPDRVVRLGSLAPQLMLVNVVAAAVGAGRIPAARRRVAREYAGFTDAQRIALQADQASPRYWPSVRAEQQAYAAIRDHALATRTAPVFTAVPLTYITAGAYPAATTRLFGMSAEEFRAFPPAAPGRRVRCPVTGRPPDRRRAQRTRRPAR